MTGRWVTSKIAIASVPIVAYLFLGAADFSPNALGQAEETFSQNTTFLEEVEQANRVLQSEFPGGKINQTNATLNQSPEMLSEQAFEGRKVAVASTSNDSKEPNAQIIVSGQNAYIVWETNETGNWEVMLRASNDNGETFGHKINLSNSSQADSGSTELAASGSKVYVIWHESWPANDTSESLLRISNDSGHNFGPVLNLSSDDIIGEQNIFLTYENASHGIQLKYPSDWRAIEGEDEGDDSVIDIVGFFSPTEHRLDLYEEKLWISLDNLRSGNITLEEYSNQVVNYKNQSLRNFRLLDNDTDSAILAGYPAYRLVYTSNTGDGIVLKQMELGTKVGDKVFYVDYYAELDKYDSFLPVIHEMINSLEIEENDNN